MVGTERGLSIPEGDPVREYTEGEEQRLTLNLKDLLRDIYNRRYTQRHLEPVLLFEFHARLFDGVRGHAGRCRSKSFGQEWLTFGPHRSTKRDDVPTELDKLFQRTRKKLVEAEEYRDACGIDETYVHKAIQLAVQTHADVIRIHPFEDGNGRTSRALLNYLLVLLGLNPIPIEAPKQEYIDCLNVYFLGARQIDLLTDLYIGLYPLLKA
ncbi:MAG: Fic family protein [Myxococcaceae bacterium]|nr:Fic family protein [Myxococcaceae bacterium]